MIPHPISPPGPLPGPPTRTSFTAVFRYGHRALALVWSTHRGLTVSFALLTVLAGALPAATSYVGQLIVDAALTGRALAGPDAANRALGYLALEAGLIVVLAGLHRGIATCQSLLRALLGHRVNVMILRKAITLPLRHFEDSEFYDKLTRARREASSRPLSLVTRTFGLLQNAIALTSIGALLFAFSPFAVGLLLLGGIPAFLAEAKFSQDAFRLFRWQSPETRKQMYLETVLAREDYVKEVQLFGLGPLLLRRYEAIFDSLYDADRRLTLRRDLFGFLLGLIGTAAFYGAYAWVVVATVEGSITLGQMTMYLLLFKQGQSAVSAALGSISKMVEDNLYLSTLYEYLEQPVETAAGTATAGPRPGDGIRFEDVSFTYPGATTPAVAELSLHLEPGQSLALVGANGSGKTTIIKLLSGFYTPTKGRITLDGLELSAWDPATLRGKIGVIFQDFARYQLQVGENVGAGDVGHFEDETRWRKAAIEGTAAAFIEDLPAGYRTQLGRWFKDGRELSGGQWQKIALSRAFMREGAEILVLDEPTAAMDPEAEAQIFEHVRTLAGDKMVVLISHRFSTVRMADRIMVLSEGRCVEAGSHDELLANDGPYARLFTLAAKGYR